MSQLAGPPFLICAKARASALFACSLYTRAAVGDDFFCLFRGYFFLFVCLGGGGERIGNDHASLL